MSTSDGDREKFFPAIEKRYGEKMAYWFAVMKKLEGKKYPEQIAFLRENYGFSQAHANAVVMYSRGSTSSKRHDTPSDYFKSIDPKQAKKIREIFKVITSKFPDLVIVIAWNQPMLKRGNEYVFGASVSKNHISIAPWGDVLKTFAPKFEKLEGVRVTKKTIAIPNDWEVDVKLVQSMVAARLKEIKA
jgi:uncharacterized protein YdhG (YjbR/CyaY superfamily)